MFFYKTGLTRRVRVHPKYLGGKNDAIQMARKMMKQSIAEEPFSPEYGYIVRLICITDVGDGYCLPLVGHVEFPVTFEAVVLCPIVGEVVTADVVMVTGTCIIFRYACVYGVVRDYSLNDRDCFEYEERALITKTSKDGSVKEGLYRSKVDIAKTIERETVVRVRILKRTLGGNGFFLIGSMFGEHLGPVANPPAMPSPASSTHSQGDDDIDFFKNLKIDDDIIPHNELQKIWKQNPYNVKPADDDSISEAGSESMTTSTGTVTPPPPPADNVEVTSTSP